MKKASAKANYKISICVVCMNRLHHLKQTLIQNINDNANYKDLEFILLNYNSTDEMDEWVMENLQSYIKSGRLIYYKTVIPDSWNPSHSKNVAFKLATGDIICNIWADYFTGVNFAEFVNECFLKDNNITLTPIDFHRTKKNYSPPGDVLGKVCVKKSDFFKVKGFDERINKHGFEDYDFINRLEMVGVKRVLIEDFDYLGFVGHGDDERYDLHDEKVKDIYINYLTPSLSQVLILFRDNTFHKATVIDNINVDSNNLIYAYTPRNIRFDYSLTNAGWITGHWQKDVSGLGFIENGDSFHLDKKRIDDLQCLVEQGGGIFFPLKSEYHIRSILEFKHFYDTRRLMEINLENQTAVVNASNFGEAVVSKILSL